MTNRSFSRRRLGLVAAVGLAVLLAASPAAASVTTTGTGKVHTGGGGAPTLVLNTTTGTITGASNTYTATGACASGAVAVAALMAQTNNVVSTFTDSSGQTWTATGDNGSSSLHQNMWKAVLGGAGISAGTTFTVNWNFASQTATSFVVACFASGNGIPTANDGNGGNGINGGSISQTITGPTVATSYQYTAQSYSTNTGATGPDAGSTGGWALHQDATTGTGYGMRTYWRKATSTASTLLNTTAGGFSLTATQWVEVQAP